MIALTDNLFGKGRNKFDIPQLWTRVRFLYRGVAPVSQHPTHCQSAPHTLTMAGGGVDKFRIKIWNKTTGVIVYDTQMGQSDEADPTTEVGTVSSIVIKK